MESAPISALNRQLAIIFNKQPFVWGGRWWHAAGPDFQHYPLYPLLLQTVISPVKMLIGRKSLTNLRSEMIFLQGKPIFISS